MRSNNIIFLLVKVTIISLTLHAHLYADVPWNPKNSSASAIASLFNHARSKEGLIPLKRSFFEKVLAMSEPMAMLTLINQERSDRGLRKLYGVSPKVSAVSKAYANALLESGHFSHRVGAQNSWGRLFVGLDGCFERLPYAENLANFLSNRGYQTYPVVRAVFGWLYQDKAHAYRHKEMLLYQGFGTKEGRAHALIGLGISKGSSKRFAYSTNVVLNYIEPCKRFDYSDILKE